MFFLLFRVGFLVIRENKKKPRLPGGRGAAPGGAGEEGPKGGEAAGGAAPEVPGAMEGLHVRLCACVHLYIHVSICIYNIYIYISIVCTYALDLHLFEYVGTYVLVGCFALTRGGENKFRNEGSPRLLLLPFVPQAWRCTTARIHVWKVRACACPFPAHEPWTNSLGF